MPGLQRTTGSVVYPAGGGLQIGIPGTPLAHQTFGRQTNNYRRSTGAVWAYPVYVGGYPEIPAVEPVPAQPSR